MTSDATDRLDLVPALFTWTFVDGNITRHPESHFLDFVVNGLSLSMAVSEADYGNLVTPLNRPFLPSVPTAVDHLLGRSPDPDLEPGRNLILVCGVCGGLDCGAVTAQVLLSDAQVTWCDWRLENGYEDAKPFDAFVPTMTFERRSYETQLIGSFARLDEFPYHELAHQGRGFLWPWQWGWRMPAKPQP